MTPADLKKLLDATNPAPWKHINRIDTKAIRDILPLLCDLWEAAEGFEDNFGNGTRPGFMEVPHDTLSFLLGSLYALNSFQEKS